VRPRLAAPAPQANAGRIVAFLDLLIGSAIVSGVSRDSCIG